MRIQILILGVLRVNKGKGRNMLDTGSRYKLTAIVFHRFYRKFEQVRIKWLQEINAVTWFCLY